MREEFFSIPSFDGHRIYGVLNQNRPANCLVIFVHGLTGEKENHLYYNAARFFPERGIDTCRFDLFSNERDGRRLVDSSLSDFSQDLSSVVQFFADRYQSVHVVGHSIGGCIAMNAKQSLIRSFILWDTGLQNGSTETGPFEYDERLGYYVAKLKIQYMLSPKLIKERAQQGKSVVKKVKRPIMLIFAGNTTINESWVNNFEYIDSTLEPSFETITIDGAGHGFNELGKSDEVFAATYNWVSRVNRLGGDLPASKSQSRAMPQTMPVTDKV